MKNENARLVLGYIMSNILGMAVLACITLVKNTIALGSLLGLSTFLLLPLAMGMVCAWYWKNQKMRTIDKIGRICLNMIISFGLAVIFIHEGVYCLIIVSPLVFATMITGLGIGNAMFKQDSSTLNFSATVLLILLFILDMRSPHHYANAVSDEITVNVSPAKVWPYVVSFPKLTEKSHYWFFDIGLPKPVGTSVTGYFKGAGRKCIFERGLVFDEVMSTYEPGKNLTFDIVKQPQDPEIMGHINIEKGQFLLRDNHNGTTTLIGTSWYSLNVFPALYFDIWARSITRNVHVRVMEHIKALSEKQ